MIKLVGIHKFVVCFGIAMSPLVLDSSDAIFDQTQQRRYTTKQHSNQIDIFDKSGRRKGYIRDNKIYDNNWRTKGFIKKGGADGRNTSKTNR